MKNSNKYKRRSIRLKDYDYSMPGEYFVTLCTYERECILGKIVDGKMQLSEIGHIARQSWEKIPIHFPNIELDEFVIMPNHIHGIIILTESVGANYHSSNRIHPVGAIHESPLQMTQQQRRTMTLSKIIGRFKMLTAKEINLTHKTSGHPVWQRNYFEHIVHDDKDLNNVRDYIANNPFKWLLDSSREIPDNFMLRK